MNIIEKKVKDLIPYEKNPRFNESAVEYVANSIKEFGFKQPIVIDKNNVIVCGHTRHKAAQRLKLKTVPCIMADDLTDEQIKAYRLADNKVSEFALWDMQTLNDELDDILNLDMDLFGFGEGLNADDDPMGGMDEDDLAPEEDAEVVRQAQGQAGHSIHRQEPQVVWRHCLITLTDRLGVIMSSL